MTSYKFYFRKSSFKKDIKSGVLLLKLISKYKPMNFLEIGVLEGATSRNICELLNKINNKKFNYFGIDLVLYTAYIVLTSIITSVLYFGVKSVVSDKTSLIRTLKSVGSFLGLFIICYVLSSGNETPMRDGKVLSAIGSRLVGTGIRVFYILVIVAVGLMIFSGGKKFIKK